MTDSPLEEPPLAFEALKVVHVKVSKGVTVEVDEDVTFDREHGEYVELYCPKGVVGWIINE